MNSMPQPSATTLYAAGLLAEQQGDLALAHTMYAHSAALDPHYKTLERLGSLAADSGNWEAAAAHFLRATEASPEQARPHFFLAQAYLELGKADQAAASAATAVRLNPQYVQAGALLASIAARHPRDGSTT